MFVSESISIPKIFIILINTKSSIKLMQEHFSNIARIPNQVNKNKLSN
jgi:hypothetical protein